MNNTAKYVMLSFDAEEFDIPRERGRIIPLKEKIRVSKEGANIILDILQEEGVPATFFCTTTLLFHAPRLAERIIREGHEIASHGCDHANPQPEDMAGSKRLLEMTYGVKIHGYRQPRMRDVDNRILRREGYAYNSSLNPTFIPGRYLHLNTSRLPFMNDGILQIPVSVTPLFRIPLFWLSAHHFPKWMYETLVKHTMQHDGFFNTYFHPWEFVEIQNKSEYGIPYLIGHNSGDEMQKRLKHLILTLKKENAEFVTYDLFSKQYI